MKCKNCGHEIGKVANKLRHITKNTATDMCRQVVKVELGFPHLCSCTNPVPESEIVVEYNKNPHGKGEIGITEAEVSQ